MAPPLKLALLELKIKPGPNVPPSISYKYIEPPLRSAEQDSNLVDVISMSNAIF